MSSFPQVRLRRLRESAAIRNMTDGLESELEL